MHTNYDELFNIDTSNRGKRAEQSARYFQYEATPYPILHSLFTNYQLKSTDHFVDIGSGKGRLIFYVHHHFNCTVTGVEMNKYLYDISLENKRHYALVNKTAKQKITIKQTYAEQFQIQKDHNIFYLFNPFSLDILEKILLSILQSVQANPRTVDLIFYYPSEKYISFLDQKTSFKPVNRIEIPGLSRINKRECFIVYRLK